jgi:hypothetical protein
MVNTAAPPNPIQLGLLMILLGLFASWAAGSDIAAHWPVLVFGAKLCDGLILASGVLLLAAGVWHLRMRGARRAPPALGAVAAGTFALTLFAGVLSGAIPCSGPG